MAETGQQAGGLRLVALGLIGCRGLRSKQCLRAVTVPGRDHARCTVPTTPHSERDSLPQRQVVDLDGIAREDEIGGMGVWA